MWESASLKANSVIFLDVKTFPIQDTTKPFLGWFPPKSINTELSKHCSIWASWQQQCVSLKLGLCVCLMADKRCVQETDSNLITFAILFGAASGAEITQLDTFNTYVILCYHRQVYQCK